jgi:superfamily II DNA or RNA helicase
MIFNSEFICLQPQGFAKTIAQNLDDDGLVEFDGETLKIENEKIYEIEPQRRKLLGLPSEFDGFLGMRMHGTPNATNCFFSLQFADSNGQTLANAKHEGAVLAVGTQSFLLPLEFFVVCERIKKANATRDEFDYWGVIESAKNGGSKIRFEGLPEDNEVQIIEKVKIDVATNDDGSLTLSPLIGDLTPQGRQRYDNRISDEGRNGLLVTEVQNGKTYRYGILRKALEASRRIIQKSHIPKEDAARFFANPQAALLEGEETPEELGLDFGGNYRIVGIGEPYFGYFGSVPLDSPIARILSEGSGAEIAKQTREATAHICEGKSAEEIRGALRDVEKSIKAGHTKIEVFGAEFFGSQIETVKNELKKILDTEAPSSEESTSNQKLVLKILYNDDESIEYRYETRKPIEQITTNNSEQGRLFDNLIFPPKSYQIEGVNWLIDLYESGFPGGLLADDMGLGKTYQLIAFFDYLFKNHPQKRILIVAPTILIDNWKLEIEKFIKNTRNFKVKILRGKDLTYRAKKDQSFNSFDVTNLLESENYPSIILTTYQTLTNYQFPFSQNDKWHFDCVVFDEAHNLKNPSSQQSQAARAVAAGIKFKVLLTGTPIENELRDLWALFDIFDPSHFGSWKKFKKEFVGSDAMDADEKLRAKASNYILRRLKKDYLKELPKKQEKVYRVPLGVDTQGYLDILNSSAKALTRMQGLKEFCLHKKLADKNENQAAVFEDRILENFAKTVELLRVLDEIKSNGEKVIMFVLSRLAQDMLRHHLQAHFGITISVINGDSNKGAQVENSLKSFKSQNGFAIIILSPLAAGVGLTITEANHVIHYERWWNASKEDQASDRAYRIGQTKDVFVHYILATLDEKTSFDEALHELITVKRKTAGFLVPPKGINESDLGASMGMEISIEEKLDALDGSSFEDLIFKLYAAMGYDCEKTPNPEYGADAIATKENERLAIQCKYSRNGKPRDKEAIRQLIAEADYWKPTIKIAATNTAFDKGAKELSEKLSIKLLEREKLLELIVKYSIFDNKI